MPVITNIDTLTQPAWVHRWTRDASLRRECVEGDATLKAWSNDRYGLVRAKIDYARQLSPSDFETSVAAVYQRIHDALREYVPACPVRFWNWLPGLNEIVDTGRDRYMVFNKGRHRAMAERHSSVGLANALTAASTVGHDGDAFIVDALTSSHAGAPVENPRQRPSYHYSKRYGPLPPCFSRATLLNGDHRRRALLISGTASIVDEQTVHAGDLSGQFDETCANLSSLTSAAALSWADICDLRVYYPRERDRKRLDRMIAGRFAPRTRLELIRATLCRPDLLVEIEGLACDDTS